MSWNWELPNWPDFIYSPDSLSSLEKQFLLGADGTCAFLKNIDKQNHDQFLVEILSSEGVKSSLIEGEILDRETVQSSIKKHFGLKESRKHDTSKESRMAHLLCDVYNTFNQPLTHEMLWKWQNQLLDGTKYRTHAEAMQIVSRKYNSTKVFFEAPPSSRIMTEMSAYIDWFNVSRNESSILGRAAIAHLYFESIRPFEDGNGRIGRILVGKVLSQELGRPALIAISNILQARKKDYYGALEQCNCTLEVDDWIDFFARVILEAQEESNILLNFLIEKSKMFTTLSGKLHPRQQKVLSRMFAEGPTGFKEGLSAENYIAIAQTSRATATRDLNDLVQKGALFKTGELRHTRYFLRLQSL